MGDSWQDWQLWEPSFAAALQESGGFGAGYAGTRTSWGSYKWELLVDVRGGGFEGSWFCSKPEFWCYKTKCLLKEYFSGVLFQDAELWMFPFWNTETWISYTVSKKEKGKIFALHSKIEIEFSPSPPPFFFLIFGDKHFLCNSCLQESNSIPVWSGRAPHGIILLGGSVATWWLWQFLRTPTKGYKPTPEGNVWFGFIFCSTLGIVLEKLFVSYAVISNQ